MWQNILEKSLPFLLFTMIIALSAWSNRRHNRDAARKGQNPRNFNFRFGRNSFRKEPEQPYTADRKINRSWEP